MYFARIRLAGSPVWHYIARGRLVRKDNAKAYPHPSSARVALLGMAAKVDWTGLHIEPTKKKM